MTDTLIDRRDLAFQLYEVLDTENLTTRERFSEHNRDTFDAVIETADKMAREKFATHNSAADKDEPKFVNGQVEMLPQVKEAFDAYAQAGFHVREELRCLVLRHTAGPRPPTSKSP